MAWTAPTTRTTGTLVTASIWNTDLADNLTYLKDKLDSVVREITVIGWWPSATSGCGDRAKQTEFGTNKVNMNGVPFAKSVKTYAEFTIPAMPSDWDGGTITAKFIWYANDNNSTNVKWGLAGRSHGDAETLDQAFGTAQEVTDSSTGTANQRLISSATSAITLAGTPAAGETVQLRCYRDGTSGDTLNATAVLLGVVITYTRA